MRRNFFVEPAPVRSNLLQMELRLAYILKNDIEHAVLNEDAVRQYVEDLKAAQDSIVRENPKLRRVEISTDIDRDRHLISLTGCAFITIGQYSCPLLEITKFV